MPKGVIVLGLVSMFMDISSEMIHSLLPIFLVSTIGVSALAVGIIEGVAEATANIVKVFSGALSDFIGKRKPLLLAGYGLATLTRPMFPMADSFMTVLIARFTDRIGKGIRVAPRDALMADITPPDMRGSAYGLRQSLDTLGSVAGPALALLLMLLTANDVRFVFWVALIPATLAVLFIIFKVKENTVPGPREKKPFPLNRKDMGKMGALFWWVCTLGFILTLARFSDAFLVLRIDSMGLGFAYAPATLIVMNIFYTLSSYPAGILSDKIGKKGLLLAGIVVLIAADLVLAFANHAVVVFAGAALWGLHMGLTQGTFTALIADIAPDSLRGTAFGLFNLASGVGLLLASVLAGWMWTDHGPAATFTLGACFAAVALTGFVTVRTSRKL